MEEFRKIESLVDRIREYINTRVAQAKLSIVEKISAVAALILALLTAALVLFLFLVLGSIAGAIAIGQWLHSYWLGFLIMSAFIFLLGLLLWIFRQQWLQQPIMRILIKTLFSKEENEDEV
jgi:ABC-type multidrug transport system permease subunit